MPDMTDILTAHQFAGFDQDYGEAQCACGETFNTTEANPDDRTAHAAHVAAALEAAGYGNQHEAWEVGFETGQRIAEYAQPTPEQWENITTNPYPRRTVTAWKKEA